jgi:myosin-5
MDTLILFFSHNLLLLYIYCTQDVFMAVQEEYKSEGLRWEQISYADNAYVLDLVEGRMGIMAILNEECMMPKGGDLQLLAKLKKSCAGHAAFSFPSVGQASR